MRPGSQLVLNERSECKPDRAQPVSEDAALAKPSNLREFLGELRKSDSVSGYHYVAPREPTLVEFPEALDARIRGALEGRGISKLYSHQAESFALSRSGKNVVVVTPTASGKTLCYNLPVFQR